jgi:hypothetical protein
MIPKTLVLELLPRARIMLMKMSSAMVVPALSVLVASKAPRIVEQAFYPYSILHTAPYGIWNMECNPYGT